MRHCKLTLTPALMVDCKKARFQSIKQQARGVEWPGGRMSRGGRRSGIPDIHLLCRLLQFYLSVARKLALNNKTTVISNPICKTLHDKTESWFNEIHQERHWVYSNTIIIAICRSLKRILSYRSTCQVTWLWVTNWCKNVCHTPCDRHGQTTDLVGIYVHCVYNKYVK